jgi:hypothetical protein
VKFFKNAELGDSFIHLRKTLRISIELVNWSHAKVCNPAPKMLQNETLVEKSV